MTAKTAKERQRAFRADLKRQGLTEVRGIFAKPEQHQAIKEAAKQMRCHISESVASAGEEKQANLKRKTNTWTPELLLSVLARKESGESLTELGKDFGITRHRMSDVILRAKRLRKRTIDTAPKTVV